MNVKYPILSQEGNPEKLVNEMKRLTGLGLVDRAGKEQLLLATAIGTGRSATYDEAARVAHWAFETLLAASVLESVLAGQCDIDASGEELKFGMTSEGQRAAEEAIMRQVQQNEGLI